MSSNDNASVIMWDITGRYILSCIIENKEKPNLNCGYKIYNLKGETLYTGTDNKIRSMMWRPRFIKPKDKDSFSKDELAKIVEEVRIQDEKQEEKSKNERRENYLTKANTFVSEFLNKRLNVYNLDSDEREKLIYSNTTKESRLIHTEKEIINILEEKIESA